MQYTVVHSKDPYLLARLATDLQMSGVKDKGLSGEDHPFNEILPYYWLRVWDKKSGLLFMNHSGLYDGIRHELTSRNYIKVLTQILSSCLTTS